MDFFWLVAVAAVAVAVPRARAQYKFGRTPPKTTKNRMFSYVFGSLKIQDFTI